MDRACYGDTVQSIQSWLSATLQWRHVRRIRNDIHHLIRINALARYPSAFASACKYNGLGAYVDPFPCSRRPITITITNTIDSRCDCPISSDRGRSILRLIPDHARSQPKVRCILYVGAPSVPFRLLSHRTFFLGRGNCGPGVLTTSPFQKLQPLHGPG